MLSPAFPIDRNLATIGLDYDNRARIVNPGSAHLDWTS